MRARATVDLSSSDVRSKLRRLGARAKKGLAQHFLVDQNALAKIISAADLNSSDIVIEVGPGLGILTTELVKKAGKVIAVEVDSKLASALQKKLSKYPHLNIINADILELDPAELIGSKTQSYKVVANLPYYIAAPILRHFLEASHKPSVMVVMVQKEVAQSIVAQPGEMSILGISVQLYGRPTIVDYVPARSFYPQPKVDSAILRIEVYSKPAVAITDVAGFFQIVKAGFSAPRKQIRNSLAQGLRLAPQEVAHLLKQAKISPQRRPETLSLEEWAKLQQVFAKATGWGSIAPSGAKKQ